MKTVLSALIAVLLLVPGPAFGRPAADHGPADRFISALPRPGRPGVPGTMGTFGTAQSGTTYYGGTVWAADSLGGKPSVDSIWTFDTGVGSHYDYSADGVNPYKYGCPGQPAPLRAPSSTPIMEGWVGFDTHLQRAYLLPPLQLRPTSAPRRRHLRRVRRRSGRRVLHLGRPPA